MLNTIQQNFSVNFTYNTYFTEGLFQLNNPLFQNIFQQDKNTNPRKLSFVIDAGVVETHPQLIKNINLYCEKYSDILSLQATPLIVLGGEQAKNNPDLVDEILEAIDNQKICRHSYLVAIGGGAVLDMAGYAAAIAHRGVRLIRIPTTVLSQNDSGVGVKNGINYFGKKNFLGTFKPPFAVINDFDFLDTLHERDWRSGISEALKVALIKDEVFFRQIQADAEKLNQRDKSVMQDLIYRCAEMHLDHIASGDPFEMGSARPLDFGHWAAHKLEHLTHYELRHGEAVAIGIALDVTYSYLKGMIQESEWEEILDLIHLLGFDLFVTELEQKSALIKGLTEFQEHLGGELTITLLEKIGQGVEVHEMDTDLIIQSIDLLKERSNSPLAPKGGIIHY